MQRPLVSVCIPTYEPNPDHLRSAIESVLNQTEKKWQLFVHDDASKTDVRSIVEPYIADGRIAIVKGSTRRGIGANWNAARSLGSQDIVAYLFQDDLWEPTYLEEALKILKAHPNVGMVAMGHRYAFEGAHPSHASYKELEAFRETHLAEGVHRGIDTLRDWLKMDLHPNIIGEPDFIVLRKSLMQTVGGYCEDMPQNLDMEYSLRCLLRTDWYYIKRPLGTFRVHGEAASARNEESGVGIYDRLRCFEHLIALLPEGELKNLAVESRNRALTKMARKYFERRKEGRAMGNGKGGMMKQFAKKHPLLMAQTVVRALFTEEVA